MRIGRVTRGGAVASLAAAALVAISGLASAQESATKGRPSTKGTSAAERASGVIVKVEPVKKGVTPGDTIEKESKAGRTRPWTHRLSINTNAVWRDWARDQAQVNDRGPARKDAAKGDNSVATKGEPADANSLVLVDIGPDTKIETRFRAPDDETSKGEKTPAAATSKDEPKGGVRAKGSAVRFRAEDLKPGLFVEVEFRHITAQNPASVVTVIRPVEAAEPSNKTGK